MSAVASSSVTLHASGSSLLCPAIGRTEIVARSRAKVRVRDILLVDSYAKRGIEHACTSSAFATVIKRTRDAYGALVFLARQTFVNPQRVAAVGFSAGAWVALSVAEPNSFELFVPPSTLRFQAAAAFYPPCQQAGARPGIPTLIFIGALDDWTPAADCSNKVAAWGNDGPPIELVVYPGAHHSFYYPSDGKLRRPHP
jgi:dienelactone hydrolase